MKTIHWIILAVLVVAVLSVFGVLGWAVFAGYSSTNEASVAGIPIKAAGASGLGVTQAEVRFSLEPAGFDFSATDPSNQARMVGENKARAQVVELVGSPERINSATLASTLLNGSTPEPAQIDAMATFLKQLVPGWDGASWLNANIPVAVDKGLAETTVGNVRITLKSFKVQDIRPLFLTIQPK